MVKMPRESQGTVFTTPFNTEITRNLIPAIQQGEVTAANLSEWIRLHAH